MPHALRLLPAHPAFLADLHQLEEPLLIWLDDMAFQTRFGHDDVWGLPPGLDGEAPRTALINVQRALPKPLRQQMYALTDARDVEGANRIVGRDGHEHTPLYAVGLDRADIDVLSGLLGHLRRALDEEDGYAALRSVLEEAGDWYGCEYGTRPETPAEVVCRIARTVAVLDTDTADTRLLLRALHTAGGTGRIVLTEAEDKAASRYLQHVATVTAPDAPRQG
ncbi:hypothetical protein [Streptomyces sp. NPDC057939]|uniref:hypothetical protein n=1 Tax=Streptomyces sp. NPDC057939 TaxID=3346284 RepID=UPI0036F0C197